MIEGLKDKVVIITGGAHGIGKAYCLAFGQAGAHVVVADVDEPAADLVADEVSKSFSAQALALPTDVSNEAATKEMAARTLGRFGRIDVLINNAAVFSVVPMNRGGIETIDPEEWDRLMAVNLRGLFLCCRAVLPTMRQQKSGKIMTVALRHVESGDHRFHPHAGARSRRCRHQCQLSGTGQHPLGGTSDRTNDQVQRVVRTSARAQAHSSAR
jgi:NAD(P)-dependent dehydrogenase (short-subunit alcohol dehydrogenase family)